MCGIIGYIINRKTEKKDFYKALKAEIKEIEEQCEEL
jgi:glucosamine 6-phosphate synthetase-like amidotransferase/phosphosugar isomerase protein